MAMFRDRFGRRPTRPSPQDRVLPVRAGRQSLGPVVVVAFGFAMGACTDALNEPNPRSAALAADVTRQALDASAPPYCRSTCVLLADTRALRAARVRPDSAGAVVDLGEVTVQGQAGDQVRLEFSTEDHVRSMLPADEEVVVSVGGEAVRRVPLGTLVEAASVYTFTHAATVSIRYALTTAMRGTAAPAALQLLQRLSGSASVVAARTPWVRSSGGGFGPTSAGDGTSCQVTAPAANVCGIDVSVNPFAPPYGIGGSFQSADGSGESSTITVTFSRAVRSVTVTIYDPTFAGNIMVALDSAGARLGSASFTGSGQPGVNVPDTKTVSASGIRTITLVPPAGEYVAYDLAFEPDTCPPSSDSILDSPEVRKGFADALAHSNPDATPGTGVKKERGGYVWKKPDGTYLTQEVVDPNATECTYQMQPLPPAPFPGAEPVAKYHTHPSSTNEPTYGCPGYSQRPGDQLPVPRADPDNKQAGGGSRADWDGTADGYPLYAISKSGRIYRLDPGVAPKDRPKNPNKWELSSTPTCPTKIP